ncbi:SRPBCC family protein [Subtercola lobariae]|uniref:SRPBCC family protein n=1 Tax=Subtercola lobariae TaxID=1588641 RepID=A0A917EWH4_9MICO|nr:hypothetical protein GCM10011399_07650 [Subtercola lobariae]
MSTNKRTMKCSPDDVFAVVAEGWYFPTWVVGASRMRDVDAAWPHVGSHLHHSFGVWPALINDATTSLQWNPPHRVVMQPKGWPLGEARVTIEVEPHKKGCLVKIDEHPVRGPGALVPRAAMDVLLHIRNTETLRRLAYLAEAGAGTLTPDMAPTDADRTLPKRASRGTFRRLLLYAGVAATAVALARRVARA